MMYPGNLSLPRPGARPARSWGALGFAVDGHTSAGEDAGEHRSAGDLDGLQGRLDGTPWFLEFYICVCVFLRHRHIQIRETPKITWSCVQSSTKSMSKLYRETTNGRRAAQVYSRS